MTAIQRSVPDWTAPERPASETREQLLAAAERLFAERGFAGVSVRMIAGEAGVNWSLVFLAAGFRSSPVTPAQPRGRVRAAKTRR